MTKEILFASHNEHKVQEVREMLSHDFRLLSLNDIEFNEEIHEPFESIEENAKAKAYFVFDRTGLACFSDDSGLEVDALDGRPGVHSAHYAGWERNSEANIQKVLAELGASEERTARFQSVIAYLSAAGDIQTFRGTVEGIITFSPKGNGGFGYDPIFIPKGFEKTFGELPPQVKNKISHRAIAMQKFMRYLEAK